MNELRYVYAVTRPFDGVLPEGVRGLGGEPPRLLDHGDLVAVVGAVPAEDFAEAPLKKRLEDLDWLTATARAHEAVIGAMTTVTCTVPLRLATVCVDDSGVRRLLDAGHDRFVTTLERLEGRVEWGVKVYADPQPDPAESRPGPAAPAEPSAAPASGRDYLRRRLSSRQAREGVWERAEALSRTLHAELSQRAQAAALHRPQDSRLSEARGQNVLNAAYLVPRESSQAFVAEVGRLTPQDRGVRVELTGPWAPYSFAGQAGQAGPDEAGASR
ncbi:GvpL/GvpF family gas vesicle protein [Streptomyces chryseus]|uniref:GvpL/GvpF family gas vesicle protein n=1 Tax=Streptomyces chryseus TaxID=68186 RepID=UPI00110FA953|nr:GvpL/GvpF family gas vesicle protein [Streptomyces chryseus]GGX16201.1 gas vesicle protein [Streptomyces chryseus]